MPNLALPGDSILDNRAYTAGGPSVIDHLQRLLTAPWNAVLCAVDGSLTNDVIRQLSQLPAETTHVVVSAGGNDALKSSPILAAPAHSVADALLRLHQLAATFEQQYQTMMASLQQRRLAITLCTVYYPNIADPALQQTMVAGLMAFNDCILRTAFRHGLPVIDLRLVCTTPDDYANEIEPSARGGEKTVRLGLL